VKGRHEMTTDNYHYTECGLDYVYLLGGYELSDGQVAINNIDGLHQAIGRFIITNRKNLSGKEVRFLRIEMGMSQDTLAKLLDVSEQTIHRWESGKTSDVPKPAEALVRLLYREQIGANSEIKGCLKRIADLEEEIDHNLHLMENSKGDWKVKELEAA